MTDNNRSAAEILKALEGLDARLAAAAGVVKQVTGEEPGAASMRGLYITREDIAQILIHAPGEPRFAAVRQTRKPASGGRLSRLAKLYSLTAFDLEVVLMALAPHADQRYETIYAYLQDDVNRRRPSIGLTLDLLCASRQERVEQRCRFAADAPLLRDGLLHLTSDPGDGASLLSRGLFVDEGIAAWLLGSDELDRRLAPLARHIPASRPPTGKRSSGHRELVNLLRDSRRLETGFRVYLEGPDQAGQYELAIRLASAAGAPLLAVDASAQAPSAMPEAVDQLFHAARVRDAVLYLAGFPELAAGPAGAALLRRLGEFRGPAILAGDRPWQASPGGPRGVFTLRVESPTAAERRNRWEACLNGKGPEDRTSLDEVADLYRLTRSQIADAAETAVVRAAARGLQQVTPDDLYTAARAQTGHDLATLTRKVNPHYGWDDIVLPSDAAAQLREICWRVTERRRVMDEWGFGSKFSGGKGVSALFAGPSGTGKTMAAEVLSSALHLDLYKIDLASVVSKYIGETERNLDRIFAAARSANAVLLFDEADALFGKRSEVRDAHDRYANIEISYLLQKMEEYEGLTVLSTNLRENIDQAFARRLAFTVAFPFPEVPSRLEIWRRCWPAATPLNEDVDLHLLAAQFKLSGGNIRNIVLAAAFRAAHRGSAVTMDDLLQSTRREFQKMGKLLSDDELMGRPMALDATRRLA